RQMYDAAVAQAEDTYRSDGRPELAAQIGRAYADGGYPAVLREQLKSFATDTGKPRLYAASGAGIYAQLGETQQAFEVLEKAFEQHAPDLIYLVADPAFDSLRNDPRFQDLERRVGLVH
ncbi:MAG: TPR end-of-group domain-containing protein, partial [Terriglobia bacterium]